MIIGTAGHIDHGKTALVKALTGIDTDRLPEEKKRGITIELGFAPLELEGLGVVGMIDVPGHEDFVRSMLVGASGIDLALLVIAADEGVMPQTREHLLILELLRIPRVVIALTKTDLVDDEWIGLVGSDAKSLFVESTIELDAVIACSSRTGTGLRELRSALVAALSRAQRKSSDELFRLPVDRAFSVRGTGTVVTGTVWSGQLAAEDVVSILPGGAKARARRIEQHGRQTDRALPGSRAAIALAGVDLPQVPRGSVLVHENTWRPTSKLEALIELQHGLGERLGPRTRVRFHAGAAETGARVVFRPGFDRARDRMRGRIVLDEPLVLRGGDRFVLRLPAPFRTIGGGEVLDPYPPRRSATVDDEKPSALAINPARRLALLVRSHGLNGLRIDDIPVQLGCVPSAVEKLVAGANALRGEHNLFAREAVEQVMAATQRIIAEYEIKSPLSLGIPARTLRERLRVSDELADISINELRKSGAIETEGPLVRRTGWSPTPTRADSQVSDQLAHDICAAVREPPSVSDLVSRYGSSVPALLRHLERQGRVVQVEADRYYGREAVEEMVAQLKGELTPGRSYAPAELKGVLGSSRKYLIPFLEFCDRNGVTERRGEGRMLRQTARTTLDTPRAHS